MEKQSYLTIWGDTVDLKELLIGLFLGAVLGYSSFSGSLWYLKSFHPDIAKGLLAGYALLFGIVGCLVAGVIAAKFFKSKRIFLEDDSSIDKQSVLLDLTLNLKQESKYLKNVPPDVIEEMRELHVYELFIDPDAKESNG